MSRDIDKAQPNDLFQDEKGNMWVVIGRCDDPVIYMEQVQLPGQPKIQLRKRDGGITGNMWDGFKNIGHLRGPEDQTIKSGETVTTQDFNDLGERQ